MARTNIFFSLSHEPHLKELLALAKVIQLERGSSSRPNTTLPEGFIFPLDSVIAFCGGSDDDTGASLNRFVGSNDFLRIDTLANVKSSRIIRSGYAILIAPDIWMNFASYFPGFLNSMVEFMAVRNALSLSNSTCYANHRLSKRLPRLLLEANEVMENSDKYIPLSQLEIGALIRVRREAVALELLSLNHDAVIESKRSRIRILDIDALRRRSCGCFDKSVELANRRIDIAKQMFASLPGNLPETLSSTNRQTGKNGKLANH
jgi:hypothetical protein